MRILVTGAAGFAGQHLARELLRGGGTVWGGALEARAPDEVLTAAEAERIHWVALDVTSPTSVERVVAEVRPDRVFHLAGQSSVSRSFTDPLGTWSVNATGTMRLLEALLARRDGDREVRVVLVSSAEVYGAVPPERQPIGEDEAPRPITPYGGSKLAAEAAALQAAARGLTVTIARSFNHAGPGQGDHFALPGMARQLVEMRNGDSERELRVGNLTPSRDFLDVRDVVRAYVAMMERGESGGIYNVCSGEARAMTEIVEELVELSGTGARITVERSRFRPVEIPLLVGDSSRLRGLGWAPERELRDTLRDLLDSVEAR